MSIKVGIIGCGKIAQVRHIPEYAANPHTQVYGFYDINQARTGISVLSSNPNDCNFFLLGINARYLSICE